jgi:hypothetical protein
MFKQAVVYTLSALLPHSHDALVPLHGAHRPWRRPRDHVGGPANRDRFSRTEHYLIYICSTLGRE